jgi:hypothetical protein
MYQSIAKVQSLCFYVLVKNNLKNFNGKDKNCDFLLHKVLATYAGLKHVGP